ncbi:MAG: dUTP diphosphatase [Clostridia bacterium]|nr:dUTP diphosphatase [Clostridia bacterium]
MPAIAEFMKVSPQQFAQDGPADAYDHIALPRRATVGSAGYDFVTPIPVTLAPGQSLRIPTGIRARIDPGWVLLIFPRSGLGFKYRLQLDNTVGVIDSDYFNAANQGHIMVKLTNDSQEGKTLSLSAGERFCQGIFLPYGLAQEAEVSAFRTGGFGSTGSTL